MRTMTDESVVYERLTGDLPAALAVGAEPLRVERAGVFLCLNGMAEITLDHVRLRLETGSLFPTACWR